MLRNTKTLRRRMPLESRSLNLTRKIQHLESDEKKQDRRNQVGRGDEPPVSSSVMSTGVSDVTTLSVPPVTVETPGAVEVATVTGGGGILGGIANMIPGLGGADNEKKDSESPTTTTTGTLESEAKTEPETDKADDTKTLLSDGLDDVRKKYAEFYGVNEDDIIVADDEDDITKTGEATLEVGTDKQTRFSTNLKKGERVAVLFGITPGLKSGLLVYPDYKTVKTASTGDEMYNSRVVFDKLAVPFDDVKPGYSVKILVCYIETIAPVVKGEPLRLPYIPSISIVNYTTKEIKKLDETEPEVEEETELVSDAEAEPETQPQSFEESLEENMEEDEGDLSTTFDSGETIEEIGTDESQL